LDDENINKKKLRLMEHVSLIVVEIVINGENKVATNGENKVAVLKLFRHGFFQVFVNLFIHHSFLEINKKSSEIFFACPLRLN
jgi:hypothetical protein